MSVEGVRKETGYAAGDGKEKENLHTTHFFGDFFIISGRLCGGGRIKVTI